jgi:hypothetical protein
MNHGFICACYYLCTYETTLGWKFGNDDDNPWKMGVGAYPLPVFYWQTSAPTADLTHLN